MFTRIRSFIYQVIGRFLTRLFMRTNPNQRRVLLACHNPMKASYVAEIYDIIKGDPRIVVRASVTLPNETIGDTELCMSMMDCKFINPRIAKIQQWDLVVLSDHPGFFRDVVMKSSKRVLRIPHGIGSKLETDGSDYTYSNKCFDDDGRLIYSRIFELNHERQQMGEARNPLLKGKISVIGSVRMDRIEEMRKTRRQRNQTHPLRILVVSSWGTGNAFEYLQQSNFGDTAKRLAQEFTFTLRPHPLLSSGITEGSAAFKEQLNEWMQIDNIAVSPPGEKIEHDLARCDLMLSDDLTSVALFATVLGIPIILWKSNNPRVGEGTYLSRLSDCHPSLDFGDDLGSALRSLIDQPRPSACKQLATEIRSFPNQAEQRAREEIYDMLDLSLPKC